jgi:hypothetical protein
MLFLRPLSAKGPSSEKIQLSTEEHRIEDDHSIQLDHHGIQFFANKITSRYQFCSVDASRAPPAKSELPVRRNLFSLV